MDPGELSVKMPAWRVTAAFAVHVFTACGAACALLALIAAVRADWRSMFLWLGIALVIDGVDGTLARLLAVTRVLPRWSGELLDFVVDFAGYVFVPAYALATGGLLPPSAAVPLALLVVVTGALYFADRQMKPSAESFRGFPVLWNFAAFYVFLLKPPPWLAAVAVIGLAAASFAPFRFVHPVCAARRRPLNLALLVLWGLLAVLAIAQNLAPHGWVTAVLGAIALYFVVVGILPAAD